VYVPGIIKSISDHVAGLRASRGAKSVGEERVAIIYNDASSFTVSTMESAEKCSHDYIFLYYYYYYIIIIIPYFRVYASSFTVSTMESAEKWFVPNCIALHRIVTCCYTILYYMLYDDVASFTLFTMESAGK
jgi:hypothetical protein